MNATRIPNLEPVPSLDELARDVARIQTLPPALARALLPRVLALQTALVVQALSTRDAAGGGRDRLLNAREAAAKLGQSVEWCYKHSRTLPFAVRNGRALRFSESGIETWIQRQQR